MYGRTQLGAAAAGMPQEQGAELKRSCAPGSSSTSAQRLFAANASADVLRSTWHVLWQRCNNHPGLMWR